MDFRLTEDQESIRELARKIFEAEASDDNLKALEKSGTWMCQGLWQALGQAELLGVVVPVEYGGAGMGLTELGILLHEQGRVAAPIPLAWSAGLSALTLSRFGSESQKAQYLRKVASGESVVTVGLSEVNAMDLGSPRTQASRQDSGFVISGEKTAVPALGVASHVIVSAQVGEEGVGLFLLERDGDGVDYQPQTSTSDEPLGLLTLDNARVDAEALIGEIGTESVSWVCERAWALLSTLQVGIAEKQLEMTASYSKTREQFGQPIGTFQAVSQRAADGYIDLEAMRVSAQQAVWRLEADLPATTEVLTARYWSSEGGYRIAASAQHIHGGMGFDCDYPLYRFTLMARQAELVLGGAQQTLARLGQAMVKGMTD
ncbi:MAG: acyl-CoA dehydrogenase family protein [Myxococcota bacterium]|nr:acyl-CoA dehydrogenase family protein [Myxococcota bacterium]